jgi:hypothetical protein
MSKNQPLTVFSVRNVPILLNAMAFFCPVSHCIRLMREIKGAQVTAHDCHGFRILFSESGDDVHRAKERTFTVI